MYLSYSSIIKKRKKIFYFIFLLAFSILFNQYYGYLGIFPTDSFLIFNSGYDVMNGYFPFRDFYTTTGPILDLIQALFFKIFGVTWFSYVLHASMINFLITIATFYTLIKFKLDINYCFFYSLLVAILAYPTAGTPFMDHHSTFFSIIALFSFILALKTKLNFYWFILPIFFGFAFLSKQVPAGYIFVIVSILSIIYFSFSFDFKKIFFCFLSSLLFLTIFILLMKINKISLMSFLEQYILFPQTLGKERLEFVFPLDVKKIILRFKLIHLSSLVLIILLIKKIIRNYKYLKSDEFLINISLVASGFSLMIMELMTINEKFIFFIIPIFAAFSHIYYEKYFREKKYILYLLIFLSIGSTFYYQYNYIDSRKFLSLDKKVTKKAVDAKILDNKLEKLKWITVLYPNDPKKEIAKLQEAIKIIKNDHNNKAIVTDYQFISVLLSSYDYSPSKVWHSGATYPNKGNKYFKNYKSFFIKKLKENDIKVIYAIKPFYVDDIDTILKSIPNKDCIENTELTNILSMYIINSCAYIDY